MDNLLALFVILSMVLGGLPVYCGAQAAAVPSSAQAKESDVPVLLVRARLRVETPARWQRFEDLGLVVLDKGADWALVLADTDQLETLARLRFEPQATEELGTLVAAHAQSKAWLATSLQSLLSQAAAMQQQMEAEGVLRTEALADLRAALRALTPEQVAGLAAMTSVDDDGDGLTNTQEQWWCTDPQDDDTDDDGKKDGEEIQILKDWLANRRAGPPNDTPWPNWPPQRPGCDDKDHDSIPNLAERWELGLNMDLESTDCDKFDDGQELFGVTYCPGGDLSCGYGDLPRSGDSGYVGATMPSWVKAPGNHPLVAAFPVPEIDVVQSSLHVETVTTVTTDHTIASGTEKSYSTAKTEGTSTSLADTVTWNEWQEVSIATPMVATQVDPDGCLAISPVMQATQGLAVHSYNLPCCQFLYHLDPLHKASLKLLGVQNGEDPTERVMRGDTMRQFQEPLEPVVFGVPKQLHVFPTVGTTDRSTDGNDHNVQQAVPLIVIPRVL